MRRASLPGVSWNELLRAAEEARARAYAPFSRFAVGAAIETASGVRIAACNVENRSYGLALCAERGAIAAAVAAGHRKFRRLVVLSPSSPPAPPCGMCRETLTEFCPPELPILLANPQGERVEITLGELFPYPFELAPPQP